MSQITLVRHGQANSGATDEESYDRLSPLGHEQAAWLGDYMRDTHRVFDTVYTGTLRRQIETASGMQAESYATPIRDDRLNELSYYDISNLYNAQTNSQTPEDREGFFAYFPRLFAAWQANDIDGVPESFAAFEERISAVVDDISARDDRALVISSGGVIGMIMRQRLGLNIHDYAHLCLAILNTSVHRLERVGSTLVTAQFNSIAHLEQIGRHHAQTHI